MKKKYIDIKGIKLAFVMIFSIYFIITGCMESFQPPNETLEKLTVQTFITIDSSYVMPLNGVEISIYSNENTENNLIKKDFTKFNGTIEFDLPTKLNGTSYIIIATYNNTTQIQNIAMCNNQRVEFNFDTSYIEPINCNNLTKEDSVVFVDNKGSRFINQNTPKGINYYTRNISIINSQQSEPISVVIPKIEKPFFYKTIFLDNQMLNAEPQTVVIDQGQKIHILIGAMTDKIGEFNETVKFQLTCTVSNQTGNHSYYLKETVIEPECKCNDYSAFNVTISEPVPVGNMVGSDDYVLTNELPCDVTISEQSFDGNDGWKIISPSFPLTLKQGEKLHISSEFTPYKTGINIDTLKLLVIPIGNSQSCNFNVIFKGIGCSQNCPLFSEDGSVYRLFKNNMIYDTLSNRSDNYVKISISDLNSSNISIVEKTYHLLNPDSSCTESNINVIVKYPDNYSKKYYNVIPSTLYLNPGEVGNLEVIFTAPTLDEFEKIVKERSIGRNPVKSDSAFSVEVQLTSGNCVQKLHITAVINALPDISPIINLRAFDQRTPLKQDPENEVYTFGSNARTILKEKDGSNAKYPPKSGDIWIDVANNNVNATPPQPPMLKVVNNNIQMKLWKSNYAESDFSSVTKVFNEFLNDPSNRTGYSSNTINNINVRDVYAFKIDGITFALIYIRRVDNGTEATSSKQSGIEFRSIYPIYIP